MYMYIDMGAHRINHPQDSEKRQAWDIMVAIKQGILRRFESFPMSVKICGAKFIQRVVLVQTPGLVSDPRVRLIMDGWMDGQV